MCDIKEFRIRIKKFAKEHTSDIIRNSGVERASCLMSTIYDNSSSIKMLSGRLSDELTDRDEYKDSLHNFLNKPDVKFELLLENNDSLETPSKALELILEYSRKNKNIKVKKMVNRDIYNILKETNDNHDLHFAVADDSIYRYEYMPKEYKANASFNMPKMNNLLKDFFDRMFKVEEEIE